MIRAVVVLLLAAAAARAGDVLVRVSDGRKPVEDAAVKVLRAGEEIVFDAGAFAPDALTTERGDALVAAPGDGTILVYQPGYALAVALADSRIIDVELRPERVFWGTVANDQGKPVAGATVELGTSANRKATFLVRSGDDGRFFVYGLWLDDFRLRVEAPDLLPDEWKRLTEDDRGREYRLTRPATVRGIVRDDRGEPVPDVEVIASNEATARTGAGGTFEISRLPPRAEYVLRVAPPYDGRTPVFPLYPAQVRAEIEIVAARPATARLRVLDEKRMPLAGVEAWPLEARSDETGVFLLPVQAHEPTPLKIVAPDLVTAEVVVPGLSPATVRDLGDLVLLPEPEIDVWVRLPDGTPAPEGKVNGVPLVDGMATVRVEGYADVEVPGYPELWVECEPPGPVQFILPELVWLDGIVFDPAGAPATGVAVHVREHETNEDWEATTNAEGRFRIGPFAREDAPPRFVVSAEAGAASAFAAVEVRGEGLLEIHLEERDLDLLRGRVLRGDEPVRRFAVDMQSFVSEEGRFEILVSRREKDWVRINADGQSHTFELPPPGEPLVARLPGGALAVRPEDGRPGRKVWLTSADRDVATRETGADGTARFTDLGAGAYVAHADGFLPAEVAVDPGAPVMVTLAAASMGTVRVRWRGEEDVFDVGPGVHELLIAVSPHDVLLSHVVVREGAELFVDLDAADAGSLVVTGRPRQFVTLRRAMPEGIVSWFASCDESGRLVFEPLRPGTYELSLPLETVGVSIAPGGTAVVDARREVVPVTGRVLLRDGTPVQGAEVWIEGAGHASEDSWTDLHGRFHVGLPPGEYRLDIDHEGCAPAVGHLVVLPSGVEGDTTFVLEPSARGVATVLGLAGERLRSVRFRVNGVSRGTDALGRLDLPTEPATVDFDHEGFAAIRGLAVRDGDVIHLQRGSTVTVLCDAEANDRVRLRVEGREWERAPGVLYPLDPPGLIERADLPVGPAEVVLLPREEGEEPYRVPLTLLPGGRMQVDLRGR